MPPALAGDPGPRSWRRAFGDLGQGWRQRPLWGYLGWQDIKQRYRRSVLGPLWISISMGVIATAMGILYGALFGEDIATFLPYVATGLLIWNFVSGCILEGSEVFIANEGLIKFLPAPLSLHVYRLVWRQTLFFLHNLVIWGVLMIVFPQPLGWSLLLAIPARGRRTRAASCGSRGRRPRRAGWAWRPLPGRRRWSSSEPPGEGTGGVSDGPGRCGCDGRNGAE